MDRRYLALLLCAVSLSIAAEKSSPSAWEDAFARRNYRLGMSLHAFRAEQFPDADVQVLQDPENSEVLPVCSDDPRTQQFGSEIPYLYISDELEKAGVVVCRYYYHYSMGSYSRLEEARLVAAEWGTATAFYFIRTDESEDFHLFKIESTSKAPVFDELLQAYTAALGRPRIETRQVQNRFGAKFDNRIALWTNDVSTLRLERYYSDLETLGIILTLKPLAEFVDERIRDVALDRVNRL